MGDRAEPEMVPRAYGGYCLETMDSHGGWIGTTSDVVRFASAFDFPQRCKILKEASVNRMFAPPPGASRDPGSEYYAFGWRVKINKDGKMTTYHSGRLKFGCAGLMVRRSDGVNFAVIYNTTPPEGGEGADTRLNRVINQLKSADWPTY